MSSSQAVDPVGFARQLPLRPCKRSGGDRVRLWILTHAILSQVPCDLMLPFLILRVLSRHLLSAGAFRQLLPWLLQSGLHLTVVTACHWGQWAKADQEEMVLMTLKNSQASKPEMTKNCRGGGHDGWQKGTERQAAYHIAAAPYTDPDRTLSPYARTLL